MPRQGKKVLVAMSGGVDSSVAAAMLLREGYDVVGCFMRLGGEDSLEAEEGGGGGATCAKPQAGGGGPRSHKQGCCSVNDAADARLVAATLGVPFYVMNFKKDFGRIIDYFVDEYNAGRTPNPCVRCNDWLKFGKLHRYARDIDCDYVASGHYARVGPRPPETDDVRGSGDFLRRGLDAGKDQSYVLFGTPRARLAEMLLPIGEMHKAEVRDLAERWGLPVFDKPDSQEICFVPDQDYAGLVERRTPGGFAAGRILSKEGAELGAHAGHQHFTLGQRRGVGVALGYPIYVVDKDPAANTVTVGGKADLLAGGCTAHETNWLIDDVPRGWRDCSVKVRYNSPPTPGRVRVVGADGGDASGGDASGGGDGTLEVAFDEPVSAVTPGQAVVCYAGDTVLGGGWIETVQRHDEGDR